MPTIVVCPLLGAMIEAEPPRGSGLSPLFKFRSGGHKAHHTVLADDEDHWEDQRGKSLGRVTAFEADTPMRRLRATAPSWPEAKGFTNRPDIRSQSQP